MTDHVTGLVWADTTAGDDIDTYAPAETFCDDLDHANRTDWRLPTRFEVATIMDMRSPAFDGLQKTPF